METQTQKPELIAKAWIINNSNFSEPWYAPTDVVYSEDRNKAKKQFLSEIIYENFKDKDGNEISFLNLNIVRAKNADKYKLNGEILRYDDIEYRLKCDERNNKVDKLVSDNPDAFAYIRKGANYYRPNNCGYTEQLHYAGVYSIQEAARSVKSCSLNDCMQLILINKDEHNKMIAEKIADLQTRFI